MQSLHSSPPVRLPDGLTPSDLLDALRKVATASRPVPLQMRVATVQHSCTPLCTFVQHMSIYVCVRSGNFHVCSMAACRCTTLYEDEYVCDITGNYYGLEAIIPPQYDNARPTAPRHPAINSSSNTSAVSSNRKAKRPRVAKGSRLHVCGVSEKHNSEALNVLTQVLRPLLDGEQPVTERCNLSELIAASQRLWSQCVSTNMYKLQPFRYRHRYHVLVVLYASIKGLKVNTTTIVPQQDVIKRCLPPFKTLPRRIQDLDQSTFTKTNKIFLACMRELYTSKPKTT